MDEEKNENEEINRNQIDKLVEILKSREVVSDLQIVNAYPEKLEQLKKEHPNKSLEELAVVFEDYCNSRNMEQGKETEAPEAPSNNEDERD